MTITDLSLDVIRIDGGTQSRQEINLAVVAEYSEALQLGETLPPVVVFHDGADHWLADGFHRFHASRQAKLETTIPAHVHQGTLRDAVLFAAAANTSHGLRRTSADKRKAVSMLLADPEWSRWSAREIARRCGVTHTLVNELRGSMEESSIEKPAEVKFTTRHGTTATRKVPAATLPVDESATPSQFIPEELERQSSRNGRPLIPIFDDKPATKAIGFLRRHLDARLKSYPADDRKFRACKHALNQFHEAFNAWKNGD